MLRITVTEKFTIESTLTELAEWHCRFSREVTPICQEGSDPSELERAFSQNWESDARAVELLELMETVVEKREAMAAYYEIMLKYLRNDQIDLAEDLRNNARGRNEELMQLAEEFEEELNWALVSHHLN